MAEQTSWILRLDDDTSPGLGRVRIDLAGEDVERFLQGLLSADVEALAPEHAQAACLLTVKGKIVTEVLVVRDRGGSVGLIVPVGQLEACVALLDRYIIMDDVTPTPAEPAAMACVWGPGARELVNGHSGELAAYKTRHPVPGWIVVASPDAMQAFEAQATVATPADFTTYRIETASPLWSREIMADRFPPEVGFVYAVNYNKGCFMGQEPLARIHARGQVNRVMVRVRAEQQPSQTAPVQLDAADKPDVGRWTSWVGASGAVTGLAIVRRKVATPGTMLMAGELAVEVCSAPLGDDPGVGNRHDKGRVQLGKR
ncbi:MAG: YgfZ/GcvT domain-containing protein [Nannocystaceae bacterium]